MTTALDHAGLTPIAPGDDGYDAARQAFNLTVDQRPALIATPGDAAQVAAAVRLAAREGLRVAPQGGAHNAAPLGSLEGTLLLKTSAMKGVEIDAAARTARVQAGAKWQDVVPRASELGLAALHGSSPDVGVVGYSLGGGMGWYARRHGLQANAVTAIELVTADGEHVRADHDTEPELFWALRGGGGNFGVVTAIEFGLIAIEEVYAGTLFFPYERAAEVMHAWREWTQDAPDEVTSTAKLLRFPPLPDLPEMVRGQSFAVVSAAYLGGERAGAELMRPLRELGAAMDSFAMVPPAGLGDLAMDPPDPVPYLATSRVVGELTAAAVDDLLAVSGPGSGSQLVMVELRHAGGALSRGGERHGAIDRLAGEYVAFALGAVMDEATAATAAEQLGLVSEALAPYAAGHYLNFTEQRVDLGEAFAPAALDRLRAAKRRYDPGNRFQANHALA